MPSQNLYHRPDALSWLDSWRDKPLIKVMTGIRRAGKSTVFLLFQRHLAKLGISPARILSYNFEDPDLSHLATWQDVWQEIKPHLSPTETTYLFLDEIQLVPSFERLVDGLFSKGNVDLYITGSNAFFLSGELGTLLTGRYVNYELSPFSFAEFHAATQSAVPEEDFRKFLRTGGFPLAISLHDTPRLADEYLSSVLDTLLFKDVMARHNFRNPQQLLRLIRFLISAIGSPVSPGSIAKTLKGEGLPLTPATLDEYLSALTECYLFHQVQRYDIRGKSHLKTLSKYYLADTGFKYALLGSKDQELGHLLENVIYLELRRRFSEVFTGKLDTGEVDFVAFEHGLPQYYQVALTVRDPDTLSRELAPLKVLKDNYPKFIITLDCDPETNYDGIRQLYAIDFLLGKA